MGSVYILHYLCMCISGGITDNISMYVFKGNKRRLFLNLTTFNITDGEFIYYFMCLTVMQKIKSWLTPNIDPHFAWTCLIVEPMDHRHHTKSGLSTYAMEYITTMAGVVDEQSRTTIPSHTWMGALHCKSLSVVFEILQGRMSLFLRRHCR
jgi:hypothetical protein